MPSEFDYLQLPLETHEARCRQLAVEGEKRKQILQTYEDALREEQTALEQLRRDVQNHIEQAVQILLPNLSQATADQLFAFFPNETNLFQNWQDEDEKELSLWEKISESVSEFFGHPSDQMLEQKRILLRQCLWRLQEIPDNSGQYEQNFRALLDGKKRFIAQENTFHQHEAQTIREKQNLDSLSEQINNCRQTLERRKRPSARQDADWLQNDDSNYNHASFVPPIFDSSSSTDTANNAVSTNENNFSFGGGGDFAGGGAGGGWDNYS